MSSPDLLRSAALWAAQEMGHVHVGDRRRTQRLVTVTAALAQNPNGNPAHYLSQLERFAGRLSFVRRDRCHP